MPHIIIYAQYVLTGAAWLWGFWALVELTDAGPDFMLALLLIFLAGVIGLAWVCCFAAAVFAPSKGRRFRWLFWSVPLIGVGVLMLSFTDAGLKLRVWLCESTLREHAEVFQQNPKLAERQPDGRVGLFRVQSVRAEGDQVAFRTGRGFLSDHGIVYRPGGAPPTNKPAAQARVRYEHLYGPWWRYEDVWD